jgi:hypothetical protein
VRGVRLLRRSAPGCTMTWWYQVLTVAQVRCTWLLVNSSIRAAVSEVNHQP